MRKLMILSFITLFLSIIYISCGGVDKDSEKSQESCDCCVSDSSEMTDDGYNYIDDAETQGFDVTIDSLIRAGVAIGDTDEGV